MTNTLSNFELNDSFEDSNEITPFDFFALLIKNNSMIDIL